MRKHRAQNAVAKPDRQADQKGCPDQRGDQEIGGKSPEICSQQSRREISRQPQSWCEPAEENEGGAPMCEPFRCPIDAILREKPSRQAPPENRLPGKSTREKQQQISRIDT